MRRVGGHVSIAGGLDRAIENTLKIGGNCMQIFAGSPRLWARTVFSDEICEHFKNEIISKDLSPVFIHALYLVNLATDKPELLEKSLKSLDVDLTNAEKIGAVGVIVHIGSHQGRGFGEVFMQLTQVISDLANRHPKTNLILENDAGQNGKIGSLEEISEIINTLKLPNLKVCLDTAHLFESGIDYTSTNKSEAVVIILRELNLLENLICLHLNDSATDLDSHNDRHANLGEGKIGHFGLSSLVNHQNLIHLPLILETPGTDHSGPNATEISTAFSLIKN